jgi:putative aldouronate transport system substrate-binding protein
VWVAPEAASELATVQTNIGTFIQHVENIDKLGLERFLQIYQQSYDRSR